MIIKTELGYLESIVPKKPANIHAANYMRGTAHDFGDLIPIFTVDIDKAMELSKNGMPEKIRIVIEYLQDVQKKIFIEIIGGQTR